MNGKKHHTFAFSFVCMDMASSSWTLKQLTGEIIIMEIIKLWEDSVRTLNRPEVDTWLILRAFKSSGYTIFSQRPAEPPIKMAITPSVQPHQRDTLAEHSTVSIQLL